MTRAQLVAYALPAAVLAMLTGPVLALLPDHYTADLGFPLAATGAALLVARVWDALCDPLIGLYADRIHARIGRRKLLMLAGAPLIAMGAWLLFTQGAQLTPLTLALASMLLFTGWTLAKLAHDAWGAELSPDGPLRLAITGMREGIGLLGGLVAILLIGWGKLPEGPGMVAALRWLFWTIVALMLAGWAMALWRVTDPPRPASPAAAPLAEARAMLHLPGLVPVARSYFLNALANALPATLFLAYVAHVLAAPQLQGPLILTYFLSAMAGVPLWIWLGKRLGKQRAWRLSMGAAAMLFAPALFLGPGDAIWFVLVCVGTGICLGGDLLLPPAIQADLLDADQARLGRNRGGLLFALLGFLSKFAYALAPGMALPMLAWASFQASPKVSNGPEALWMLALLYAGLPALIKLLAVYMLRTKEA